MTIIMTTIRKETSWNRRLLEKKQAGIVQFVCALLKLDYSDLDIFIYTNIQVFLMLTVIVQAFLCIVRFKIFDIIDN